MPPTPDVSVIMNCRNGERYLRPALDSVFAQTFSGWEIIFWDNSSTDGSAAIAREYGDRVRYFYGGPCRLYAARNRAIEHASGRYLGFLDTDDIWLPRKLELQVRAFERNPAAGLVYSNAEFFDDAGGSRVRHRRAQPEGFIFRRQLRHYDLLLPTVMIRRSAFDARGGFDEGMEVSGDTDLFLNICQRFPVAYVDAVTARYREHPASTTAAHPESFVDEAERILRKFRQSTPDFDRAFADETMGFMAQRRKAFVFGTWRAGDARSARRQAWQYLRGGPAMALLLAASFFPFSFVHRLRQRPRFLRPWSRAR